MTRLSTLAQAHARYLPLLTCTYFITTFQIQIWPPSNGEKKKEISMEIVTGASTASLQAIDQVHQDSSLQPIVKTQSLDQKSRYPNKNMINKDVN